MSEEFKQRLERVHTENYEMYCRLATRLLRIYTGQTDQAKDIVQDAFEKAQRKPEQSSLNMEKWISKQSIICAETIVGHTMCVRKRWLELFVNKLQPQKHKILRLKLI